MAARADAAFTSGLVSVDFNGASGFAGLTAHGFGVIGSTVNDVWNGEAGNAYTGGVATDSNLKLVDGFTSSGATLSYQAPGNGTEFGYDIGPNGPNADLTGDYLLTGNSGTPGSATISGLSPTVQYALYIYNGANAPNRISNFLVTNGSGTVPGTITNASINQTTSWVSGSNYLAFNVFPNSSGQIQIQFVGTGNSPNATEANFAGFQLQAVPEPASLCVLTVGAFLLSRRRGGRCS